MANGQGDRRLGPSSYAEQLQKDLASGRPIPYRRYPVAAGSKGRDYYNPYTGERVSEHYVIRVYRPNLTAIEREVAAQANRRNAVRTKRQRKSMLETYLIRKQADEPSKTLAQLERENKEDFLRLYVELRAQQIAAKNAPLGSDEREEILSGSGRYAEVLVELGRRLPNDDFLVGMSPAPKGGYIDTVVVPYYNEIRGY